MGMPRPWRPKALRSDGQVVPSWVAAALTLPSCSASWKARSASARSVRKRLGCQPRWLCQDGANQAGRPGAPAHPRGARLVSELCPERLRESSDTGQVDRDLCLPFPSSTTTIRVESW